MGITLATFNNSGTSPHVNERSNICASGVAILLPITLNTLELMPSPPGALLFGNLYNILVISSGVTGLQNMLFLLGEGRYFINSLLLPELNDCAYFTPTEQNCFQC